MTSLWLSVLVSVVAHGAPVDGATGMPGETEPAEAPSGSTVPADAPPDATPEPSTGAASAEAPPAEAPPAPVEPAEGVDTPDPAVPTADPAPSAEGTPEAPAPATPSPKAKPKSRAAKAPSWAPAPTSPPPAEAMPWDVEPAQASAPPTGVPAVEAPPADPVPAAPVPAAPVPVAPAPAAPVPAVKAPAVAAPAAPVPVAQPPAYSSNNDLFIGFPSTPPAWMEALYRAAPPQASTPADPNSTFDPEHYFARDPETVLRRFLLSALGVLLAVFFGRIAGRAGPAPVRRLTRWMGHGGELLAGISGVGLLLSLLPVRLLPWLALATASGVVAAGWAIRPMVADVLAGIILRVSGALRPGRRLASDRVTGVVRRPGMLATDLASPEGHPVRVPNRRLLGAAILEIEGGVTHVEIQVELLADVPEPVALAALQEAAIMLPWADPRSPAVCIHKGQGAWVVQLGLLGEHPPVDRIRAALPGLARGAVDGRRAAEVVPEPGAAAS